VLTGNPPRPTSAKVAEQAKFCFLESLRACSPRALTVRETDKGTVRQFSIVKGERCILRQAFQASADTPPAVVDCAGARLENNALLVQGCSHLGDFVLTP
jgi:hypothetical protein